MSNYNIQLTPAARNLDTEGSLDTAIVDDASIQRKAYLDVYNNGKRKIVEADDGESFNDTMQTLLDNVNLLDANPLPFNIIDNSNDNFDKKVVLFIANEDAGEVDYTLPWMTFIVNLDNDNENRFNPFGSNTIETTIGLSSSAPIMATNGYNYERKGANLVVVGSSGSGSAFKVTNTNSDVSKFLEVTIRRNGSRIEVVPIHPSGYGYSSGYYSFSYIPTIFIAVTDTGSNPTLADTNTEISLFGVAGADLVITGGGVGPSATPYSISLANIVYA